MTEHWTFTLKREVTETYREGWGVAVFPLWDSETEGIADVSASVIRIDQAGAALIGGAWCVSGDDGCWVPIGNFRDLPDLTHDDQHDLRDRWFATETEATEHCARVLSEWENPTPWQSFVTLD